MQIIQRSRFPLIDSGGYNSMQVQRAVVRGASPVQYSGGALYGLGAEPETNDPLWPLLTVIAVVGVIGWKKGWF